MHAQTPFQFLPPHIVQIIVNYVVGSSRVLSDGILPDSIGYRMLLKPLLWTCHNFRAVAYPCYCVLYKLGFVYNLGDEEDTDVTDNTDDSEYSKTPSDSAPQVISDPSNAYLGYPTLHLFKELEIAIDEISIYSGTALQLLSCPPYDGCPFPQVRNLNLCLSLTVDRRDRTTSSPEDKVNISAFVERIKEMVPLVSRICLEPDCTYVLNESNNLNLNDLVSQLFRLATHIEYTGVDDSAVPVELQLEGIRDLVYIKYTIASNDDDGVHLVRLNAPTLQSLDMEYMRGTDLAGLFQNAEGENVTYPYLHTLKLREIPSFHDSALSVSQGFVPFPSLRHIRIKGNYPFGDDTLFRGNAALLESVDMKLHGSQVDILRKYDLLTSTSLPKLKYAGIDTLSITYPQTVEKLRLGLSIGIRAPVRKVYCSRLGNELAPAFISVGNYAYIRVLVLPHVCLAIWDILDVIKSLPLLSDLHAVFPKLGTIPSGVALDDLPVHVVSTYAPMGEKFRCWNIDKRGYAVRYDSAKPMLMLALVCPNFVYSVSPSYVREGFKEELEAATALDMFKDYAPRLRHLLSHGWSNC
ncbi:hypothetical protein FBU31_001705 [Coemansia sp. 'formosensis']|nr:hypothetical protein FBU31_001705 [Coemansia sp. 'formosensis']